MIRKTNLLQIRTYDVEYGDVIGFYWNNEYFAGIVVRRCYKRYSPTNHEYSLYIVQPNGVTTIGVFHGDDKVDIFYMIDRDNPARTRNERYAKMWANS